MWYLVLENVFAIALSLRFFSASGFEDLNKFEANAVVDFEALKAAGLVKKELDGLKILGNGELSVALTVKANKFSASAVKAIEAAGGKTEVIER